jgi:hypothetical protein
MVLAFLCLFFEWYYFIYITRLYFMQENNKIFLYFHSHNGYTGKSVAIFTLEMHIPPMI